MMTGKMILSRLRAVGLATFVVLLMAGCHDGAQVGGTIAPAVGPTTSNGPESPVAAQPDSPVATTPESPGVTPPPLPTTPTPEPPLRLGPIPSVAGPVAEPRIDVNLPDDRDGDGLADGEDPAPAMRPLEGMEFAFGPTTTNGREDPQVVLVPSGERAIVAWVEDGHISLSIFNIRERRYELSSVATPVNYTHARQPRLAISPDGSKLVLLFKCDSSETTLIAGEFLIDDLVQRGGFSSSFKGIWFDQNLDILEAMPLYLKGKRRAIVWSGRHFLSASYRSGTHYYQHDSLFLSYFDDDFGQTGERIELQSVDARGRAQSKGAPLMIDNWKAVGLADGSIAISLRERICEGDMFACTADERNMSGRTSSLFVHEPRSGLSSVPFPKDTIVLLARDKSVDGKPAFEAAWWDYPHSADNTDGFSFLKCNYSVDAGSVHQESCYPFEYRAPLSLASRLVFFDSLAGVKLPGWNASINAYAWREERLVGTQFFQSNKLSFFKAAGSYQPLANPIDLGNGKAIALAVAHDPQQANSLRYFVVKEDGSQLVARFEHVLPQPPDVNPSDMGDLRPVSPQRAPILSPRLPNASNF